MPVSVVVLTQCDNGLAGPGESQSFSSQARAPKTRRTPASTHIFALSLIAGCLSDGDTTSTTRSGGISVYPLNRSATWAAFT